MTPDAADRMKAALALGGVDAASLQCSTYVSWERNLNRYAKTVVAGLKERWKVTLPPKEHKQAVHYVLGYLVRTYFDLARPHNLGVMALKGHSYIDQQGRKRQLLVFRSALAVGGPRGSACFGSLVQRGAVRHVINLYGGTFPFHDVVQKERQQAQRLGVSYYDVASRPKLKWRALIEEPEHFDKNRLEASRRLARLINEHLLRPEGKAPRGNLYFHCCGGMHRSGMLYGVLRRCINGDDMTLIEREYRRHVAFRSATEPGGFEPLNLRFIREFDCSLLQGQGQGK